MVSEVYLVNKEGYVNPDNMYESSIYNKRIVLVYASEHYQHIR